MKSPSTALRDLVIDAYSALTHKALVAESNRYGVLLPAWISPQQQRRLAAYRTLAAYQENVARFLLRDGGLGTDDAEAYREYGDASLLVQRVVAGVLGDTVSVVVEGADEELGDLPELPDPPDDLPDDATDLDRRIYEVQQEMWRERAEQAIDTWADALRNQPALQERQEWLRDWADRELLEQKVWECEGDAVGLGDGVYVLGISRTTGRVRLRVYPPDTYFPVLDDEAEARGYPSKVHLAWEFVERDDLGRETTYVRRITYELGPIAGVDEDGNLVGGTVTHPWGEVATETCYLTDATWRKPDAETGTDVDALTMGTAVFAENEDGEVLDRLDLGIPFLPVVHVPNTPADKEHFGRSVLSRVLQLLDDLASSDTDLQAAAALAGTPMAALSGERAPDQLEVRPGLVIGVGPNGRMDVIDLSGSVTSLQGVVDSLLDRLSVNAQVPAGLLGRIDPGEISSGIQLALSFSPFTQLVATLRLVRVHKYRLLLRFVQRMSQSAGFLEPGDTPDARLSFGSFLPEDQAATVDLVTKLVAAKALSRATAVLMLREVGLPIADIASELDAIAELDHEGGSALFDATGDDDAVRDYLRLGPGGRDEEPPDPSEDIPDPDPGPGIPPPPLPIVPR